MRINIGCQSSKLVKVDLNFRITSLVLLYIFGVYGWGTSKFIDKALTLEFVISISGMISIFSVIYILRKSINFTFEYIFKLKDLIVFTFFLILIMGINLSQINDDLTVDEVAYAWFSNLHSYVVSLSYLYDYFPFLQNYPANQVLHILNLVFLVVLIFSARLIYRIPSDLKFLTIIVCTLFVSRIMVGLTGGNENHHTPLQNLYYFVWSSILGTHNWSFRFASNFLFATLSFILFKICYKTTQRLSVSYLLSLLIISIPLSRQLSLSVEIASWTFIISSITLAYFASQRFEIPESALLLLALCTYLRINIIAIFLSTCLTYFVQNKTSIKIYSPLSAAIVISIPSSLFSFVYYRDRESMSLRTNYFRDMRYNLSNQWEALIYSQNLIYVLIGFFASLSVFLMYPKSKVFLLTYCILNALLFLAINSSETSTYSKYIAEWGLSSIFLIGAILPIFHSRLLVLFLSCLLALNLYGFYGQVKLQEKIREVVSDSNYNYNDIYIYSPRLELNSSMAYKFIQKKGLSCLSAGPVNGAFPEILNGFNLEFVKQASINRNSFLAKQDISGETWLELSSSTLDAAGIKCTIVGAILNPEKVKKNLLRNGWLIVKVSRDLNSDGAVTVFVKTA